MKQQAYLCAFVLAAGLTIFAQNAASPPSTPEAMPPDTPAPPPVQKAPESSGLPIQGAAGTPEPVSLDGCLREQSGSFLLQQDSGSTVVLSGPSSELARHIGQQVRVTGMVGGLFSAGENNQAKASTEPGQGGESAPGATLSQLAVQSVSERGGTCASPQSVESR